MPFTSKAQQRFAFATKQSWADEFAKATPSIKGLPQHVKKAAHNRIKNSEYQPNPTSLAGGLGSS